LAVNLSAGWARRRATCSVLPSTGWCLLVPHWLLGRAEFGRILSDRAPLFSRANWLAALLWLAVTLTAVFMYAGDFLHVPLTLILLAIPLATVNGLCEEIMWCGLYPLLCPVNLWLAVLYPAFGFAAWPFAPQTVFPAENISGFVISTFFLGLAYAFIAYRTWFCPLDGRFPQFQRDFDFKRLPRAKPAHPAQRQLEFLYTNKETWQCAKQNGSLC
jgi:hypothetical protein